MSLTSSPDYFLRPEDKALKLLFPTADQPPSSFDEFFDRDFYDETGEASAKKEDDENNSMLDFYTCSLTNGDDLRHAATSQSEQSPPQPWRKGLWCLSQNRVTPLIVEKTRKANPEPLSIVSPSRLVVNDNFALKSPRSKSLPHETKNAQQERSRQSQHQTPAGQQRTEREMKLSPSPMYSRSFANDRNEYVDTWQQDFQNLDLHFNDDYLGSLAISGDQLFDQPYHAPVRSKRAYMGGRMEAVRASTIHDLEATANRNNTPNHVPQELSSIINANFSAAGRNMFSGTPDQSDMSYRFITEDLPGMSDWTATESLHSSNSSYNSQLSNNSIKVHSAGLYNNFSPQSYWYPPGTNQQAQASHEQYSSLIQPKPRRATHHVLHQDDEVFGLDYPSSEEIGVAVPYHPPELQPSLSPTQMRSDRSKSNHPVSLSIYPVLPPPGHRFPEESPFTTPRRKVYALSRTPSPTVSPTHRSARSMKQRSPSRRDPSQHRRKSIHKSGPIRGSETPRHRSTSRPPRTPKTPKTPGEGFQLDFVNFTPRDANKLLNDVAPSGSSKTRARREQEARDRRKKFSEVALATVRQLGGDAEALERDLLT